MTFGQTRLNLRRLGDERQGLWAGGEIEVATLNEGSSIPARELEHFPSACQI